MIKLFFFIVSFTSFAQTINIPDTIFKNRLLAATNNLNNPNNLIAKNNAGDWVLIDTNNDGEIQQNEALVIYYLAFNSGSNIPISDLTGIEYFTNLTYLSSQGTENVPIYFPTLTNLKSLDFSYSRLSTINFEGLSNLEYLDMRFNQQFTQLHVSGLFNLKTLVAYNNQIATVTFQNNPLLEQIDIENNQLSTIDVTMLPSLTQLNCENNLLTSINFNGLPNLLTVRINNNLLTSLDISNTNIEYFVCSFNQLTSLTLNSNLRYFYCNNNQISALDFENLPTLKHLNCSYNQLTGLDFTNNPLFDELNCRNNNLMDIKIKNGLFQQFENIYYNWNNNPNLSTVCADDFEIQALRSFLSFNGYNLQNLTINSNCNLESSRFEYNNTVVIAPNPNNGNFIISFDSPQEKVDITVFNVLGQEVSNKIYTTTDAINYSIIGNSGLYFLKIEYQNGDKKIVKVVKEQIMH